MNLYNVVDAPLATPDQNSEVPDCRRLDRSDRGLHLDMHVMMGCKAFCRGREHRLDLIIAGIARTHLQQGRADESQQICICL